MKRIASSSLRALACALLVACVAGCGSGGKPRIGIALASVDDGYVASARRALEEEAAGKAKLTVLDGQNQRSIQDKQLDSLLVDEDALIVNPVDGAAIEELCARAQAARVPIVFFGRNLPSSPLPPWRKSYFIGGKIDEADALQAEMIADYWKARPEADKDKDGKLEYLLLRGDSHHGSALAGEAARNKVFEAAGVPVAKLSEADGGWTRAGALGAMGRMLAAPGGKSVEAVICANDEMALGAVEALKMAGLLGRAEYTPVVGIDGTSFAVDAIGEGSLLGTVRCDADGQGRAAALLACSLAAGGGVESTGLILADGRFLYVPYQKVTRNNYKSAQ